MTIREYKRIAQKAMKEQGMKVNQKDIVLLEGSGDGSYVMWRVDGHEYQWSNEGGFNEYLDPEEESRRIKEEIAELRREETYRNLDPEMYYEMLSAFGHGETIVNVITGEIYYL